MKELKKNQIFTVGIESYSSDGYGVCRVEGRAVFVPRAIVGEQWRIRIVKVSASAVFARGEELLSPSACRVESSCPYFGKCGGCDLCHMRYDEELNFKLSRVNDALTHIGKQSVRATEILGSEKTERYRNKAIFAVAESEGSAAYGFFRERSHQLIPIDKCLLQDELSEKVAASVVQFMNENAIPAYDEESGRGVVRHVFCRRALHTGDAVACIVAARGFGSATGILVEALRQSCPELSGIVLNINKSRGNTVLAGDFYTLWGRDDITDSLCGVRFNISPQSFFQINPPQAEKLYARAVEYAAPARDSLVFDLYCGAGTISLCLAQRAGQVIGAEIVPEAIENAKKNAEMNGISNTEFLCADAGQAAAELAARGLKPDAVVVDPPRKGMSEEAVAAVASMAPERVVYVSCNPATLARDILRFNSYGYTLQKVTAVDMFPRTCHVETVVCLSREKADNCGEKPKMISDERSKYKSWSNLKKQMNDLLCDSLKDKITYFYTSYHEVHNAYGRATINYCKKELVAFSWVEMYKQEQEVSQLYSEGKKVSYGEMENKKWMPACKLCDANFIKSLTIYLKTDIATSLQSDNYLLRVFAYMDRRVGKRTLNKIKDEVEKLPEWVKQFYQLRCEADGIVFPPKRITDETVVLMSRI